MADLMKKILDWSGDSTSVYKTLGASNHADKNRNIDDYYATQPKAVELLLEKEQFSPVVWENAVGGGHIADVLKQHGYDVKCSDIIDRGYPNTQIIDFLYYTPQTEMDLDIITNPPYQYAKEFVEKSLQCVAKGHKVAMFLKLQFLEGKERRKLFDVFHQELYMCLVAGFIVRQMVVFKQVSLRLLHMLGLSGKRDLSVDLKLCG